MMCTLWHAMCTIAAEIPPRLRPAGHHVRREGVAWFERAVPDS